MSYAELPPRAEIRPWVAAHWHFRVVPGAGEIEHRVPLTGGLIFHVRRGAPEVPLITGPRIEPLTTVVRGGDEFRGTHLWPGAAASLLGIDPASIRESVLPAVDLLDEEWVRKLGQSLEAATESREATELLDDAWSELARAAGPLDGVVMEAVFRILRSGGEARIDDLARAVGLSPRQLRRRFRAAAGLSPKELSRLRRLRSTATRLVASGDPWIELAAEHGYADQAHLVREYRALLGTTPTEFRSHVGRIEHGPILS